MISNQILQNTIDGLKGITRVNFCVIDMEGNELATTMNIDEDYREMIRDFVTSPAESQVVGGYHYFKIVDEQQLGYILLAKGDSDDVFMIGNLAAFQLQNLLVAYKEKFDKDNFIKSLILDNLLLVDIYSRARKLRIDTESRRAVFIVELNRGNENAAMEALKNTYSDKNRDFITSVDENNIILIKELSDQETYDYMDKIARDMLTTVKNQQNVTVRVAYGTIVRELKEVSRSYKEAKMALEVGKIFFLEKEVVSYSNLGIGRLIYQLPLPLCKMFIKEIFDGKSPDEFDEETLTTINKFFENNLNVSETSRQLFVHRNTLVYRLDKLQKTTGLDLRVFEDAITFKISLMVVRYMRYMEKQDF